MYKPLTPPDPQLKGAWFQPLILCCEVKTWFQPFAFHKCNLYRYIEGCIASDGALYVVQTRPQV